MNALIEKKYDSIVKLLLAIYYRTNIEPRYRLNSLGLEGGIIVYFLDFFNLASLVTKASYLVTRSTFFLALLAIILLIR